MASLIFNSCLDDALRALIDFDTDSFKAMLCTASYAPDKDAHTKRSDITDEVVGSGYTDGGEAVSVGVTKDNANDRIEVSLGGISLPNATITARGAVYYKSRGGAATADELLAYIDFGSDIASTNGTWSLSASTLRLQN
jgi:hypothetical protein